MKSCEYLSLNEVVEINATVIARFGGKVGVRDYGLLASALSRPQSGYYESLSEQAAALLQSLCLNHCFIDGNKRTAFVASVIFLRLNGSRFACRNAEVVRFIEQNIIEKHAPLKDIAKWIAKHCT